MLNFGNREFRNIQEQVAQNQCDIQDIKTNRLNGLIVSGYVSEVPDLPQTLTEKDIGIIYQVGQNPTTFYILDKVNPTTWTNITLDLGDVMIGPHGPKGEQGPQGSTGKDGQRGSKWISGGENPSFLPNNYLNGDHYLNTITGDVFKYENDTWVATNNIRGPQGMIGPRGLRGLQGEQGIPGIQGPVGPRGPQGTTFRIVAKVESEASLPVPPAKPTDAYLVKNLEAYHLWLWVGNEWVDQGEVAQTSVIYGKTPGTVYEGSNGAKLEQEKTNVAMVNWGFGPIVTNKNQFYGKVSQVFVNKPTQSIYMYGTPEELNNFFTIWGMPEGFKATHAYIAIKSLSNESSRISFKMYLSSSNYGNTHEITVDGYNGTYLSDSGWINLSQLTESNINNKLKDYAKTDGFYELMTVGESLGLINPLGKTIIDDTFIDRPAANGQIVGSKGTAVVKEVGGNTIKFNQLIESFETINLSVNNSSLGTLDIQGQTAKYIFKKFNNVYDNRINLSLAIKVNHTYMLNTIINPIKSMSLSCAFGGIKVAEQPLKANADNNMVYIITNTIDDYNNSVWLTPDLSSFAVGDTFVIKAIRIVDLTEMYGEGNEPVDINDGRINGLKRILQRQPQYNTGELISATPSVLTSYGKNIFNTPLIFGNVFSQGNEDSNNTGIKTDFIKINSKYITLQQFNFSDYTGRFICYYDENRQFIDRYANNSKTAPFPITLPNNARYIKLYFTNGGNQMTIPVNPKITLIQGLTPLTEYLPYRTDELITDYQRYFFDDVMRGVGDIRDTLDSKQAVIRLAEIDLGSDKYVKSYWFQENSKILIINLKEIGITGSDKVAAQALCSRYPTYSQNELIRYDKGISFLPAHGNEYYAYIKDPQLYQGMNFALFLKGVKAVYPLATPLVIPIEPERGLAFYGELGGREVWDSDVPVYTSISYEADMAMKLAVLDDQEQTDAHFAYIEREINNLKPSNINIGALDFDNKRGVLSIVPAYGANVLANDGSRQIEFKITAKYLEIVFGQFWRYDDGGIYTIAISKTGKYRLTKTGNFTVI